MPGRRQARGATLTSGVVLGGVLLLAIAMLSGVGQLGPAPVPEHQPAPAHGGPQTAVQPALERALLADQELPEAPASTAGVPDTGPVPTTAPGPRPVTPPVESPGTAPAVTELCRALLEDPAGLPLRWSATSPQETTAKHTTRRGGAQLHQVLSVFPDTDAAEAYGRLRETATACDEFTALLDGLPVTVLLHELDLSSWRPDRRESAGGDDTYAMLVTVQQETGTLVGWLALDRVGSVVSVLHHLGPPAGPVAESGFTSELARDLFATRRSALGKLRPLLDPLTGAAR